MTRVYIADPTQIAAYFTVGKLEFGVFVKYFAEAFVGKPLPVPDWLTNIITCERFVCCYIFLTKN